MIDDESFWKLHASDPNYMCLGDYFQSNVSFKGEYTAPDIEGDEVVKTIRSVRKDLLVSGEISDQSVSNCAGGGNVCFLPHFMFFLGVDQ